MGMMSEDLTAEKLELEKPKLVNQESENQESENQESQNLKLALQQVTEISREDWLLENRDSLIEDMLEHIGDLDPELRDELIYSAFARWIGGGYLSAVQLAYVSERCLELNQVGIGEKGTDTVFTRSFAILVLACVLSADRKDAVLSGIQSEKIIRHSLTCLRFERDTRGFVPQKGWAHAIAHGADLLAACVQHPAFQREQASEVLEAVGDVFFRETVYTDDEDGRMATVIDRLLERGLAENTLAQWIKTLPEGYEAYRASQKGYLETFHTRIGLANFLKTLYFRLDSARLEARAAVEQGIEHLQAKRRN